MKLEFAKYQGAGNDFVIADVRNGKKKFTQAGRQSFRKVALEDEARRVFEGTIDICSAILILYSLAFSSAKLFFVLRKIVLLQCYYSKN